MGTDFKISLSDAEIDSEALADELERIAMLVRDGFTSGDMGAKRGWWSASELNDDSPVDHSLVAKLEAQGFSDSNTGGGCRAMYRDFGTASVMVTDSDAGAEPQPDDWIIGAYNEDGDNIYSATNDGSLGFDAALESAIRAAESADMEQSARRRGDI